MTKNIFSALSKYDSASPENYLTESFVFLLNNLLEREHPIAIDILNKLCVNNNEFSFCDNEEISISTQVITDQGTPDIMISSPDKLIYIEVKQDSPLGYKQVERYKNALSESPANFKYVILLTRFAIELEEKEKPYKHILWHEAHNWLLKTNIQDHVSKYLRDSFIYFLKEKHMSIEKIDWEYIKGVPSLVNLLKMIEFGIENLKLKIDNRAQGNTYIGRYFDGVQYWCGIWFDTPLILRFEMEDKNKFDPGLFKERTYDGVWDDGKVLYFNFELEKIYFFSLDKDKQQEAISKFISTCYKEAQLMRKINETKSGK